MSNALISRVRYLRGVRRYAAEQSVVPKEILNEQGYPRRLKGFPITTSFDPAIPSERHEELKSRLRDLFGSDSPETMKKVALGAGAIPGSHATFHFNPMGGVSVSHNHQIPGLIYGDRSFHRDPDGKVVLNADAQVAHESIQGGGRHRFKETLGHLRDLGVSRIDTHAVGSKGSGSNGYYTWPRFGFNAKLRRDHLKILSPEIAAELQKRGTADLHTLFSIPGGAEAWKEGGKGINASFDLHPNSPHSKAFEEYYNGKSSGRGDVSHSTGANTPSGTRDTSQGFGPREAQTGIMGSPPESERGRGISSGLSGTGTPPRTTQTPHESRSVKPNTPLSRNQLANVLIKYAARKAVQPLDPLIAHAAHAMDHPTDDTAMQAFADHLAERHSDHPVVEPFQKFVTRHPGSWEEVAKHIHPRNVNGFTARAPHSENTIAEAQEVSPEVNPDVARMMPDMSRFIYVQDPRQMRAYNYNNVSRQYTPAKPEGFGRQYGENLWSQMTNKGTQNNAYLTFRSLAKKHTSAQVAKHIYDTQGPAGLVHLLVGLRYFHPDEQAKRLAEGQDLNARPKFSRKPKRYAKVDGDVKAHHLIEGFPIEHALRHLVNSPKNVESIRALAKSALLGKSNTGEDLHGGPGAALWALHDALHENNHLAKDWYKWMNAADKIHIDGKVYEALSRVAKENDLAHPESRQRAHINGQDDVTSLGQHTPEGVVFRINHKFLDNRSLRRRTQNHLASIDPQITPKLFNESLKRHASRAAYRWVKDSQFKAEAADHEKRALSDGKIRSKDASTYLKQSPKYTEDKASRYSKRRVVIQTDKAKKYAKPTAESPVTNVFKEYHFPEESAELDKPHVREQYLGHLEKALNNEPGTIPTLRETKALATHGEPAKGGYRTANNLVTSLLGNPLDAHRFAEATAIMSPSTGWLEHTNGALEALAHWHEAGRPTDDPALTRIFGESAKSKIGGWYKDPSKPSLLNFNGYMGIKPKYMKALFSIPDKIYKGVTWGHMTAGEGTKVPNFGLAHVDPKGKPVDTHMAKLFVPDNFFKTMHKAGFDLGDPANRGMAETILSSQKKLATNPAAVLAYGTLMTHAANELGWEPREVQEAVWVATLAAMAAKSRGAQNAREILDTFSQHSLRQGWDMRPVLTDPSLMQLLHRTFKTSPGDIHDAIAASDAGRPLEAGGKARTSDFPAYATAVARLPARSQPGAAGIVSAHLLGNKTRTRKARPTKEVAKYAAGQRNSNFLDSLRHIQASNNLVPIAKALAAKLGAQKVHAIPALHNTPQGSVPGMAMAVYGAQEPNAIHYLASQIALTNQRKSRGMLPPGVSVFHMRPTGPDSVYKFYQEGSGLDILQKLDRAGLTNRVIAPHHKGFNVIIPDKGGAQYRQMRQYQQVHGVQVQKSQGYLKNIGSPDPAKAREKFRDGVVKSTDNGDM